MARILVGIPTKDRPDYVKLAVESVLAQSEPDLRLVVSDNCSSPAVRRELESWFAALEDPRVTYCYQTEDGGEYAQGRFFMEQLREEYFVMLHDDDLMSTDYLAQAMRVMDAQPDIAFFCSGQYLIDGDGGYLPQQTEHYAKFQARDRFAEGRMSDPLLILLQYGLFSISGAMFRAADLLERGLVDDDCAGLYPFEFNVFLRVCERNPIAWYTPKRLIAYRWHEDSMRHKDGSSFNRTMVEMLIHLLEKRQFDGVAEKYRRRLLAFNYRNHALICHVAGEDVKRRSSFARARSYQRFSLNILGYQLFVGLLPGVAKRMLLPKVNLEPPIPGLAGVRYL